MFIKRNQQISNWKLKLTTQLSHLRNWEKDGQPSPKTIHRKETLKIRAEVNGEEGWKAMGKLVKPEEVSLTRLMIDKPLARWLKREKIQIIKISNKSRNFTTYTIEIKALYVSTRVASMKGPNSRIPNLLRRDRRHRRRPTAGILLKIQTYLCWVWLLWPLLGMWYWSI